MVLMEEPFDQVRRIVEDISGHTRVTRQTRLWHDLHLGGDDVVELTDRISAAFGTSFSTFCLSDFFPEEAEALGAHITAALGFKSRKKPVTVQHLLDVVKHGSWFDPVAA